YWLKAYNNSGSSPYSSLISNTTFILPQPQWISATPVATNQINLSWHYISAATSYTLFRNTVNNTNTALKVIGSLYSVTNYNDSILFYGKKYYYWLKAYNYSGSSAYSSII